MAYTLPHSVTTDIETDIVDPLYPDVIFKITNKCVVDDEYVSRNGAQAHAHSAPDSGHYGIVCIRPGFDSPALRAHEVAHLLNTESDVHGKNWRRIVTELGYPEEAEEFVRRYKGRSRDVVLILADGSEKTVGLRSEMALDDEDLLDAVRNETRLPVVAIRPKAKRVRCRVFYKGQETFWTLPIHERNDVRVNDDLTLDMDPSYLADFSKWMGETVTNDNCVVSIASPRRRYR